MAWEIASKQGGRGCDNYGPDWDKFPAIRIAKGAVYINEQFQSCFGVSVGTRLCVMCDKEVGAVGMKKWIDGDDPKHAYPVYYSAACGKGGVGPKSKNMRVNCNLPSKTFPDKVGGVFRVRLNHGERVLEAILNHKTESGE